MDDVAGATEALTVVVPAFDEAGSIRAGRLDRVIRWARGRIPPASVLVVDDGSADETADLARAEGARVLEIPHGGKAAALLAGALASHGERVLFTDMDQAVPIEEAGKLIAALDGGADVAMGTRGFRRPGAPLSRLAMSLGHWLLRRLLLGMRWRDTQCGFKAFRREAGLAVLAGLRVYGAGAGRRSESPSVTSGFDVEFLLVAERLGLAIAEVPVVWNYRETRRVSRLRDSWRGLRDLAAIARACRRGLYPERSAVPCTC